MKLWNRVIAGLLVLFTGLIFIPVTLLWFPLSSAGLELWPFVFYTYLASIFGLAIAVFLRCRWARVPALVLLLVPLLAPIRWLYESYPDLKGGELFGRLELLFVGLPALVAALFALWLYRLKLDSDTPTPTMENN